MSEQETTVEQRVAEPGEGSSASPALPPEVSISQEPAAGTSAGSDDAVRSAIPLNYLIEIAIIVVFVTTFIVQAFRVPSESMEQTLLIGDFVLADKVHFAAGDNQGLFGLIPYRNIHRGDIIVFHYPVDPSQYFVKRVIGLPGDKIHLDNKTVVVNGQPLSESYVVHSSRNNAPFRDDFPLDAVYSGNINRRWRSELPHHVISGDLVVPPGNYFVMGDNRDQSLDSRYWGFVPRSYVMGRPLLIYMSVNDQTEPATGAGNDKLLNSREMQARWLQFARWDRLFRLVR